MEYSPTDPVEVAGCSARSEWSESAELWRNKTVVGLFCDPYVPTTSMKRFEFKWISIVSQGFVENLSEIKEESHPPSRSYMRA